MVFLLQQPENELRHTPNAKGLSRHWCDVSQLEMCEFCELKGKIKNKRQS